MMVRAYRIGAGILLAAVLTAGCGSHRLATGVPPGTASRHATTAPANAVTPSSGSLSPTLESSDPQLAAALLQLIAVPSAASHREAARQYWRLGVLDKAHEHYEDAIALDRTDAVSHEATARIWRDWGTPHLGLGAAYRAVHYAPQSASAANTLGTILQALGNLPEAERWYAKALVLQPGAWFALNNICYVRIMRKDGSALDSCREAVAAAGPNHRTPQNNLALAHAAAGDMPGARQWFRRAGDQATAQYNYGITLMATGQYSDAAEAFEAALKADPHSTLAAARVRQARRAAEQQEQAR